MGQKITAVLFCLILFLSGCSERSTFFKKSGGIKKELKREKTSPSTQEKKPIPQTYTTQYNGAATIRFEPFTPVNINENAGFYDGPAGGVQFYYLPIKQIVWGYRVYLDLERVSNPADYINRNVWKQDSHYPNLYYRDFKAHYSQVGSAISYSQPVPQSVTIDQLKPGNYFYKIFPLCITAKSPHNLDEQGVPFRYGCVCGTIPSFIWVEVNNKNNWGAVNRDGGEKKRGYYEVYTVIKEGQVEVKKAGGVGGGGGGLFQ